MVHRSVRDRGLGSARTSHIKTVYHRGHLEFLEFGFRPDVNRTLRAYGWV
jgi:hypothetical protein